MAEPKCPYFGECGGCSAQHIAYELQVENKKKALAHAIKYDNVQAFFGPEYEYRNRMDFIFHPNGVGLRKKGRWDQIIYIENCAISNERINQLLSEVQRFFRSVDYFDLHKKSGTFRYAVITDPPRTGMHPRTIEELNKLAPDVMIYISCNTQQLAKELPKFKKYTVKSAAIFDLFPQTPHVEAIVELVKKQPSDL